MFKKRFIVIGVVAVVVCSIFLPPVRAAAESALSIFRVAQTKTITISVQDLEDIMTYMKNEGAALKPGDGAPGTAALPEDIEKLMERAKSEARTLSDIREFTDFPFTLPAAMKDATPTLYAVDSQTQSIILDTAQFNETLIKLGATALVDVDLNGTEVSVSTPPAIVAEYDGLLLVATQTVHIEAPDTVMNGIKSAALSIPAIPEALRAQLAAINPGTHDVYLPVVEGLGRGTDLGGVTGYIYASGDLAQVLGMLPDFADNAELGSLQNENASVLIWTKDGVLYCLAGAMSDSALTQIARSIR